MSTFLKEISQKTASLKRDRKELNKERVLLDMEKATFKRQKLDFENRIKQETKKLQVRKMISWTCLILFIWAEVLT